MSKVRRTFLRRLAATVAAALLRPSTLLAAPWNEAAFSAKSLNGAMRESGYGDAAEVADIVLDVPDIAEDGSIVPLEAASRIPGTTSMAIFVEKNPTPMVAEIAFLNGAEPYLSVHIKMADTSIVRVAVRAGGKVYTTGKEVKVTVGGCGG